MLLVKNVSQVSEAMEARGWIVNGHADTNGRTWDISITKDEHMATLFVVMGGIVDVYIDTEIDGHTVKLENSDAETVLDYILNKLIPKM